MVDQQSKWIQHNSQWLLQLNSLFLLLLWTKVTISNVTKLLLKAFICTRFLIIWLTEKVGLFQTSKNESARLRCYQTSTLEPRSSLFLNIYSLPTHQDSVTLKIITYILVPTFAGKFFLLEKGWINLCEPDNFMWFSNHDDVISLKTPGTQIWVREAWKFQIRNNRWMCRKAEPVISGTVRELVK